MRTETPKGCLARWRTSCASFCLPSKPPGRWSSLTRFPGWKLHALKGDLKGLWSLTVTGNWRLIFRYDERTNTAGDFDLIDYHYNLFRRHPFGCRDMKIGRINESPQNLFSY